MAKSVKSRVAEYVNSTANEVRKAEDRLAFLRNNERVIESVLRQCPRGEYISLWGYGDSMRVGYTIDVKGFKTAKLARELEKWIGEATEMSSSESPEYGYRTYRFTVPRGELTFHIAIEARLVAEAVSCRSVQVGEEVEIVRRPVYKFQCK